MARGWGSEEGRRKALSIRPGPVRLLVFRRHPPCFERSMNVVNGSCNEAVERILTSVYRRMKNLDSSFVENDWHDLEDMNLDKARKHNLICNCSKVGRRS